MNRTALLSAVLLIIATFFSCKKDVNNNSNTLEIFARDYTISSATIDYFSPQLINLNLVTIGAQNDTIMVEFTFSQADNSNNISTGTYTFFDDNPGAANNYTGMFFRTMGNGVLQSGAITVNENSPSMYDIDFQINSGMQGQYLLKGKMRHAINKVNLYSNCCKYGNTVLDMRYAEAFYDAAPKWDYLYILSNAQDYTKPYLGFVFNANSNINYLPEGNLTFGDQFGAALFLNATENYNSDRGFIKIKHQNPETSDDIVFCVFCNDQLITGNFNGNVPIQHKKSTIKKYNISEKFQFSIIKK